MRISKEVKIGLVAIFVLAITIWGYNFLKGVNIFSPTDEYYVVFDRVDGLIESGNIMYHGYKVGNITALEFDPMVSEQFRVTIVIDQKLKIPRNSIIKIKQTNPLASTADLELLLTNNKEYYQPGDTLISEAATGIADYIAEYREMFDNIISGLDSTLSAVNTVLNGSGQEHLQNSLASLDIILAELKTSLGPNGSLGTSFGNLEEISTALSDKKDDMGSTIDNMASITAGIDSANLGNTLLKLDSTLHSVNAIMARIDSGEGSMGKLVNDSSLYTNLDSTSYYLSMLLKDMQENPKRYVHFSMFGKKNKE